MKLQFYDPQVLNNSKTVNDCHISKLLVGCKFFISDTFCRDKKPDSLFETEKRKQ